jgi:hypothetical protein
MSALEPMFGHCRKEVQSCQVCENNRKWMHPQLSRQELPYCSDL